jgi:hypothetical protein
MPSAESRHGGRAAGTKKAVSRQPAAAEIGASQRSKNPHASAGRILSNRAQSVADQGIVNLSY